MGRNRRVENSTQGHTIDITGVNTETYDAPSELLHDHDTQWLFK
ncbi:MAG: hypothetical protein WBM97_03085 [Sedimenticolaceae bacterium]